MNRDESDFCAKQNAFSSFSKSESRGRTDLHGGLVPAGGSIMTKRHFTPFTLAPADLIYLFRAQTLEWLLRKQ